MCFFSNARYPKYFIHGLPLTLLAVNPNQSVLINRILLVNLQNDKNLSSLSLSFSLHFPSLNIVIWYSNACLLQQLLQLVLLFLYFLRSPFHTPFILIIPSTPTPSSSRRIIVESAQQVPNQQRQSFDVVLKVVKLRHRVHGQRAPLMQAPRQMPAQRRLVRVPLAAVPAQQRVLGPIER